MNCSKCGIDLMMLDNLWYCSGCFKDPEECTCEPVDTGVASQRAEHLLTPTAVRH